MGFRWPACSGNHVNRCLFLWRPNVTSSIPPAQRYRQTRYDLLGRLINMIKLLLQLRPALTLPIVAQTAGRAMKAELGQTWVPLEPTTKETLSKQRKWASPCLMQPRFINFTRHPGDVKLWLLARMNWINTQPSVRPFSIFEAYGGDADNENRGFYDIVSVLEAACRQRAKDVTHQDAPPFATK